MGHFSIDFGTTTTLLAELTPAGTVPLGLMQDSNPLFSSDVVKLTDGSYVSVHNSSSKSGVRQVSVKSDYLSADWPLQVKAILAEVVSGAAQFGTDLTGKSNTIRLGCPANWNLSKRQALLDVAESLGLNVFAGILTDEAVAASIAWYSRNQSKAKVGDRVILLDMGGGTTDVAILKLQKGQNGAVEPVVLASEALQKAGDAVDEIFAQELGYLPISDHSNRVKARDQKHSYDEATATAKLNNSGLKSKLADFFNQIDLLISEVLFHADLIEPSLLPYGDVDQIRYIQANYKREMQLPSRKHYGVTSGHVQNAKMLADSQRDFSGVHVVVVGGMGNFKPLRDYVIQRFAGASLYLGAEPLRSDSRVGPEIQLFVVNGLAGKDDFALDLKIDRPNFSLALEDSNGKVISTVFEAYESLISNVTNPNSNYGTNLSHKPISLDYQLINESPAIRKVWRPVPDVSGRIVARTPDGKRMEIELIQVGQEQGSLADSLPFNGGHDSRLLLNPNGFFVFLEGNEPLGLAFRLRALPTQGAKSRGSSAVLQAFVIHGVPDGHGFEPKDQVPSGNAGRI